VADAATDVRLLREIVLERGRRAQHDVAINFGVVVGSRIDQLDADRDRVIGRLEEVGPGGKICDVVDLEPEVEAFLHTLIVGLDEGECLGGMARQRAPHPGPEQRSDGKDACPQPPDSSS
jgi:hypothetical protein